MTVTLTELKSRLARGELSEAELNAVLDTKDQSEAIKEKLGNLLTGRKRSHKSRPRRKPDQTKPAYPGLAGPWASFYNVTCRYESKIPVQDRDDWRHDCMLELERATERDGKPLPDLRAYRIASLMVALFWRDHYRYATRVCIVNGYPTGPHCQGCKRHTESKRCAWLAVRPVERLDGEIIDPEGYKVKLLDTVASDRAEDMPERWYDIKKLTEALPLRLTEIAYKKLEGQALSDADRKYLYRYRKTEQKALF
jgi:hypothetical protein